MTAAAIVGCLGTDMSAEERRFYRDADPLGFILFQRNCVSRQQVRRLVDELREAVGRDDAPVLIDQEGGRVARLRPPGWRAAPAAGRIGALAESSRAAAVEAARLNARILAAELSELGITVDCAPVLDLRLPGAHEVIGDRAFGPDPEIVAELGRAMCLGLLDGGVLPVVKHIPGHGRALADSHEALPVVDAPLAELERTDFLPFRLLREMPWAMTAHVVYAAVDPNRPATTSPEMIARVVRGHIGFDGVLISDDLSMEALQGSVGERSRRAIAAGCDLVLHCNGNRDEMAQVVEAAGPIAAKTRERLARGNAMATRAMVGEPGAAQARLDELLMTA
jgi:beta-N-acetylhexosaminidase